MRRGRQRGEVKVLLQGEGREVGRGRVVKMKMYI